MALKTQHDYEYFDIVVKGHIELAMKKGKKVPLELKDIFSKCKTSKDGRNLLVIEGPPGIGKSTLVLHICHNWEQKKLFSEFKWVIRVPLRDEAIQNASCLADIIPARSQEEARAIAKVIIDSLGSEGLLLFDGWDEPAPVRFFANFMLTFKLSSEALHNCAFTNSSIADLCLAQRDPCCLTRSIPATQPKEFRSQV